MKAFRMQARSPQGRPALAVLFSLLVLLPAWLLAGSAYQAYLVQKERARAAEEIAARANALSSAVEQRIALLQGLHAFTRTEWPDASFDLPFEIYCAGIYFNTTGLRTLMIAPEGITRYVFPLVDWPVLSGYDVLNDPDPDTRAAVQRAIATRSITLSRPGELRQGGPGLTAWEAVHRGRDLWGLVSIAVDLNTVLQDAGLASLPGGLGVALRDGAGETFFGQEQVWERDPVVLAIHLPEGSWELGSAPPEGWAAAVRSQAGLFRWAGLVIAGLVALLVYLAASRQRQLEQAVALRTAEIAAAQEALEQRVRKRTQELASLQEVSRQIGATQDLAALLGPVLAAIRPALDYGRLGIYRLAADGALSLVCAAAAPALAEGGVRPEAGLPANWLEPSAREQALVSLQPVITPEAPGAGEGEARVCRMEVPLVIQARPTGLLVFLHPAPGYYGEEEARLALAFAQQVAVAIEKSRLYEQAGRLAVLEERQRLARELHDSVSQVLYSIGLGAKTARAALERDPARIAEALDYVNRLAEAGQVEMRALIFELRPESLRTDGLAAALEKQAAVLRARHQLDVEAHFCAEPEIPLEVKEALYRISQEAMHNIVKHAGATQVALSLDCPGGQVCLEVGDDGVGFDPQAAYPGHLGLQSMRERAARGGGQIEIDSAPGRGTRIRVVVPR